MIDIGMPPYPHSVEPRVVRMVAPMHGQTHRLIRPLPRGNGLALTSPTAGRPAARYGPLSGPCGGCGWSPLPTGPDMPNAPRCTWQRGALAGELDDYRRTGRRRTVRPVGACSTA
jgi:hypothetical protein